MKIAYLNTLGIPARYGGFETCVEEVSTRLARKGHNVTVYCSSQSIPNHSMYKGVTLINVARRSNKFLDYPSRSMLSTLDAMGRDFEILHYFGTDSSIFTLLPRILRRKTVISLDGLTWNRSSYPQWVRIALRASSWLPLYLPHAAVVDSLYVQRWYATTFGRAPFYVPYGAESSLRGADAEVLKKYRVGNDEYVLFVGRLVPEKGVHYLVQAFNALGKQLGFKLIIVGRDPYNSGYESSLRKMAGDSVIFVGYVYGSDIENLYKGAYLYVTASELEGTSPALLSAMGFGNCVLASNIPENLETIGDAGVTFRNKDVCDLREKMVQLLSSPDVVENYRRRAVKRVAEFYSWDSVAERMEQLYLWVTGKHSNVQPYMHAT
jgi:glycosyltransferase involved in cell wall biosynthesis